MKRRHTEAEFDLAFIRDLKRLLNRAVKKLELAEKWTKKSIAFSRQPAPTPESTRASEQFHRDMHLRRPRP